MPVFDKYLNEILPDNYNGYFEKLTIHPDWLLSNYIDNYSILSNKKITDTSNWLILPDTSSYLLCFRFAGLKNQWKHLFVGPRTKSVEIIQAGREITIVIKFKPGGAYPFFNTSLNEFTDTTVDLSLISKHKNDLLTEGLGKNQNNYARVLDDFLWSQFKQSQSVNSSVIALNTVIESSKGIISVKDLSGKIGLSERHILNILKTHTGLSTKKMLSITRLLNSLGFVDNAAYNVSWSSMAYQSGYSDQAHLIDDYSEMLQMTPTVFIKRLNIQG